MARVKEMIAAENLTWMDIYNIFDYASGTDTEMHALATMPDALRNDEKIKRVFQQRAMQKLDEMQDEDAELWFEVICCLELTAQIKEATYEHRGA